MFDLFGNPVAEDPPPVVVEHVIDMVEPWSAMDIDVIHAGLKYAEVCGKWQYVGQRLAVLEAHLTAREAWARRPATVAQPRAVWPGG